MHVFVPAPPLFCSFLPLTSMFGHIPIPFPNLRLRRGTRSLPWPWISSSSFDLGNLLLHHLWGKCPKGQLGSLSNRQKKTGGWLQNSHFCQAFAPVSGRLFQLKHPKHCGLNFFETSWVVFLALAELSSDTLTPFIFPDWQRVVTARMSWQHGDQTWFNVPNVSNIDSCSDRTRLTIGVIPSSPVCSYYIYIGYFHFQTAVKTLHVVCCLRYPSWQVRLKIHGMPEGFIKPYPSLFKQSLIRVRNSVNPVKITRTQYPLAQKD